MIKLKETDGYVNTLFKAGADYVRTKIEFEKAKRIVECGTLCESPFHCYPIGINGEVFFEGENLLKGEKNVKKLLLRLCKPLT